MNAHERQTTIRQRSAALALRLAPQSLAVQSHLAAYGPGAAGNGGFISEPTAHLVSSGYDVEYVEEEGWIVGDAVGSKTLG